MLMELAYVAARNAPGHGPELQRRQALVRRGKVSPVFLIMCGLCYIHRSGRFRLRHAGAFAAVAEPR